MLRSSIVGVAGETEAGLRASTTGGDRRAPEEVLILCLTLLLSLRLVLSLAVAALDSFFFNSETFGMALPGTFSFLCFADGRFAIRIELLFPPLASEPGELPQVSVIV